MRRLVTLIPLAAFAPTLLAAQLPQSTESRPRGGVPQVTPRTPAHCVPERRMVVASVASMPIIGPNPNPTSSVSYTVHARTTRGIQSFPADVELPDMCVSAASVDSLTPAGATAQTLSDALAGRVAGVSVLRSSGVVGTGSRVRIRGGSGLLVPREPMLVIDGVRVDASQSSLGLDIGGQSPSRPDDIPLHEVERITVLRGPASTAMYGANGAGGVIVVTTRRGLNRPLGWRAWAESGLAMDAGEYPANVATGPPTYGDSACTRAGAALGACTPGAVSRWNPLERASPSRTARRWSGGAHVTGGTRAVQYFATAGATGDQGVLAPNDADRWNVRLNVDAIPHHTLRFALSGSHLASGTTLPVGDHVGLSTLEAGLSGNTADDPVKRGYYQATPALFETLVTKQHLTRSLGSAAVEWSPRVWFSGRALVGRELVWRDDSRTYPRAVALFDPDVGGPWQVEGSAGRDKYTTLSGAATATFPLGPLSASTTVGVERVTESLRKRDSTLSFFLSTGEPGGSRHIRSTDRRKTVGLLATQRIAWGRRVLDLGVRHDGPDRHRRLKSATYLSASASWEIASDSFVPARVQRSGLRLHASYGEAGDARPARSALDGPFVLPPVFPEDPQPVVPPALHPEKVSELDAGAEWFMWSDRVRVDATWYHQRSGSSIERGCCISRLAYADDGTWRTTGVELTTSARLLETMSTEWDAHLTFATFSNRYDRQPSSGDGRVFDLQAFGGATRRLVDGYPIAGTWGHKATGRDANGDGVIDPSEITVAEDSSYLGSSVPTRQAGLASTLALSHRRTRISFLVDYQGGFVSRNQTEQHRCALSICNALYDPNASATDQTRAVLEFGRGAGFTERGDFVRLREVSVTWSLFRSALWHLQAGELTLTVAGRNLVTLTGYSGLDPEVNSAGQSSFGTTELFTLPLPRTLIVRLAWQRPSFR